MANRNLSTVIQSMLACIPESEKSLRLDLNHVLKQMAYAAPEQEKSLWATVMKALVTHLQLSEIAVAHLTTWQRRVMLIWGDLEESLVATPGVTMIALERRRQVEDEGFNTAHDAHNAGGALAAAAARYAFQDVEDIESNVIEALAREWPWGGGWWRPTTPIRNLTKAGALVAAEIDRRLRTGEKP